MCACEGERERHDTSEGVMKSLPPTGLSDCCQLDPAPVNPSPPLALQARAPRARVCRVKREKTDCMFVRSMCWQSTGVWSRCQGVKRSSVRAPSDALSRSVSRPHLFFGGREQQKRGGEVDEGYQHIALRGVGACCRGGRGQ